MIGPDPLAMLRLKGRSRNSFKRERQWQWPNALIAMPKSRSGSRRSCPIGTSKAAGSGGAIAPITDKDFALAKKIEEVVHWQPGNEESALEGTPGEDMRFAYIKYDKPKA